MKKYLFILGARDPEMIEIEAFLSEIPTVEIRHAVPLGTDYYACAPIYSAHRTIWVECAPATGIPVDDLSIDHHRPGDVGYDATPENFWTGSSLGQVLNFFGENPTKLQLVIAACDHCLTAAYAGLCPGVTSADVALFRTDLRAEFLGITTQEFTTRVDAAVESLASCETAYAVSAQCAYKIARDKIEELPDAAAFLGIAVEYHMPKKVGLICASPKLVEFWMQKNRDKTGLYGVPERGYAGYAI